MFMEQTTTPMSKYDIIKYYSNPAVAERIADASKGREVAGAYWNGSYDKRPNVVQYASDVVHMAEGGITSFHISVEHWQNAMMLSAGMQAHDYDKIRTGWDILLDMDSKIGIEGGKQCALSILELLDRYKIKSYGIKFSGSRGFHFVLPGGIFPNEVDFKPLAKEYPRIPRIIASYIENEIRTSLMDRLLKQKTAQELIALLDEEPDKMDPFYFVELETNWGARHMFRAPFSLNEKKWYCSIPITRGELEKFFIGMALPKNVDMHVNTPFFTIPEEEEGTDLLMDAMDWHAKQLKDDELLKKENKKPVRKDITVKMREEDFPPCIQILLKGIPDGRKRSLFTLITFLNRMNWAPEEIVDRVRRWNAANPRPLPEQMIISQLRYHVGGDLLPANCFNPQFYKSINVNGICQPDETCKKMHVKNPISYPFKKYAVREKERQDKDFVQQARGEVYKCNVCGRAFNNMKSLNRHYGSSHGAADY